MSLIEKTNLPSTISVKGLIYSALLLLLVISLFFIPEIVKFQERVSKAKQVSQYASDTVSGELDIDSLLKASKSGKSLDSILSMVESGKTVDTEAQSELVLPAPSKSSKDSSNLQALQDRVMLEKTLGSGRVTWDQLNSAEVKKAFKNAQIEASKLLRNLPAKQSSIRFALINYVNGLGWMTRADKKLMSAEEALAYIEQLDINVSQAMLTSEIDAGDFETWKKVSFGPLSANSRASAFKNGAYLSFNPRLTLTDVEIKKNADYIRRNGAWVRNPSLRTNVRVAGFVLGKDTRKITVHRDGRKVGEIRLSNRTNTEGIRTFKFRIPEANGAITFRAYSKDAQAFQKTYAFLPRVYQRFKQDEDGYYILPFGTASGDEIGLSSFDARLDRFFRVGRAGTTGSSWDGSENRGFDVF